ncbi:glycosyltransferase [Persephonella atlantica]|uniref:Glycosyltransferase n=1 Tax=Persephonella atlantica TaxID=2699429 RepID=A0ABS1GJT1_9AQUI|nr:glycosyltransferase family 2 protein [Persephonella atlantica]MBK3333194.1 glycosyltransferase [Persephonella atlantica]
MKFFSNYKKLPLVSVITVVYNGERYIEGTIQSVINQTYPNIEYIIIDGGSTDRTIDIIKNYEDYIDYWISEPDNGIYDAMNKGLESATGDIIGFLNSDDFYASNNTIEKVVKEFIAQKVDSVYGDLIYVNSKDTSKIIRYWKSKPYKRGLFKKGWHPPHPTFFVKKEVYEKYGVFNLKFKIAADYELMLRFLEKYQISSSYISEVLVKMRIGGKSNKNIKNIIQANIESYKAWKENGLKTNPILFLAKPISKIFQYKFIGGKNV